MKLNLKNSIYAALIIASLSMGLLSNVALANTPPPELQCMEDALGETLCAPREYGASIRKDQLGNIVCAVGDCARDPLGQLQCAKKTNGKVMRSRLGDVKCEGGCEEPTANMCQNAEDIFK